jgi:hypothetical protein
MLRLQSTPTSPATALVIRTDDASGPWKSLQQEAVRVAKAPSVKPARRNGLIPSGFG